jgi:hypothetical protein
MEWDAKLILSDIGINYTFEGDNVKVRRVSSISDATEDDLAFCFYHGEKGILLSEKLGLQTNNCLIIYEIKIFCYSHFIILNESINFSTVGR